MNSPAFSGAPEPGVGISPEPFDDRLRQSVNVTKVVMRTVERRHRLHVQRRDHFNALALGNEFFVLGPAPITFGGITGEQDDDGMEVRTCQIPQPIVGMVCACIAENLRAGDHALPELVRKCAQRSFIKTQGAQSIPGEGNRHPYRLSPPHGSAGFPALDWTVSRMPASQWQ